MIDTDAATAVWDAALAAPEWDRAPVWFHGDLLPGNLLVDQGRVRAVIDFGGLGVGDPACDLMIAWGLFTGESRAVFRAALGVDDATSAHGRGHALVASRDLRAVLHGDESARCRPRPPHASTPSSPTAPTR